jgi:hypothetical protein
MEKIIFIYEETQVFQFFLPICSKLCSDSVAFVRKKAAKGIKFIIQRLKNYQ